MRSTGALCVCPVAVTLPLPSTRRLTAPSASRSWRRPWALPRERAVFAAPLQPYQRSRSACPRAELASVKRRLRFAKVSKAVDVTTLTSREKPEAATAAAEILERIDGVLVGDDFPALPTLPHSSTYTISTFLLSMLYWMSAPFIHK